METKRTPIKSMKLTPASDRFPMCHAPFIEKLPGGRIVALWFAGSREWARDVRILRSFYDRKREQWEEITIVVGEKLHSLGNAVIAPDGAGKLHMWYVRTAGSWQKGEIFYQQSFDGGENWKERVRLPLEQGWLIRGRPLIRGEILYLPVYHEKETVSAIWIQNLFENEGRLAETVSSKGGLIHPTLVAVSDREFRLFFRNVWAPNLMHYAYSMNRGETWSRPYATNLPNPNSGIDVVALSDGRLLCAYNHSLQNRYPLSLALSRNLGKEWEKWGDIEEIPGEFSYPSLLQEENRIFLAYTYDRKAIKCVILDEEAF